MHNIAHSDRAIAAVDEPKHWLGDTPLLRLNDPKVRLKARSLTQLAGSDAHKLLQLHRYVQKKLVSQPFKIGYRHAREVIESSEADAEDKACLLVALTRAIEIPARIRYIELKGEMVRGLHERLGHFSRPVFEAFVGGQWVRSDVFVYDPAYLRAALQALEDAGWPFGYAIHRTADTLWGGDGDASISGAWDASNPMFVGEIGCFSDPQAYAQSRQFRERYGVGAAYTRKLSMSLAARAIVARMRALRTQAVPDTGRAARLPPDGRASGFGMPATAPY